jgi:TPR repeat protein
MSTIAQRLPATSPLRAGLPVLFIAPLFLLSFLPRIATTPLLHNSFLGACALLTAWYLLVFARSMASGRGFSFAFVAVKSHYVQALVQGSIYVYWSTAWPWVQGQVPLILAQILYAYTFDMLLSWTRGRSWRLGFGSIPIILSSNFFLCFRDDWFFLQFAMISVGLLGKEFLRWQKDGRSAHIFNPSALGLFVFSVALIVSGHTDISWAQQIAIELGRPEHMYLYIFAVGLVVQYFFHVTLVTLSAAATLFVLNTVYTQMTGIYWFLDASIPIAVFLGLHLLITDPATSPRTNGGRIMFGTLYGASVFGLYALLEWAGAPRFYDKLLCVPVLNLTIFALDRWARRSPLNQLAPFAAIGRLDPQWQNLLHMGLWVALFAYMAGAHFVGEQHPGRSIPFWEQACSEHRHKGCTDLYAVHHDDCGAGDANACMLAGTAAADGSAGLADPLAAVREFARACDLGYDAGCRRFVESLDASHQQLLDASCRKGGAQDCYVLGAMRLRGLAVAQDHAAAVAQFQRACALGDGLGCGVLGDAYRYGVGTTKDPVASARAYEQACGRAHAPSCMSLADLLARGDELPMDVVRARELRRRACRLDLQAACELNG